MGRSNIGDRNPAAKDDKPRSLAATDSTERFSYRVLGFDIVMLLTELACENYMVQVVSRTPSTSEKPLYDYYREQFLENDWVYWWSHVGYDYPQATFDEWLILWLIVGFAHGLAGILLIHRQVRCIWITRWLRVMTFWSVILPNPREHCARRLKGEPKFWSPMVGGACKDLIFSGHTVFYTMFLVMGYWLARRYERQTRRYGWLLWVLMLNIFAQRSVRAVTERMHYSIDMLVGFYVTFLVWKVEELYFWLPSPW
eukprot:Clim_evm16s141 gene=Clim_evmTU16s141